MITRTKTRDKISRICVMKMDHTQNDNPGESRSDIAHLHMRIVEIKRVGQSARILPIHVKKGVKRGE